MFPWYCLYFVFDTVQRNTGDLYSVSVQTHRNRCICNAAAVFNFAVFIIPDLLNTNIFIGSDLIFINEVRSGRHWTGPALRSIIYNVNLIVTQIYFISGCVNTNLLHIIPSSCRYTCEYNILTVFQVKHIRIIITEYNIAVVRGVPQFEHGSRLIYGVARKRLKLTVFIFEINYETKIGSFVILIFIAYTKSFIHCKVELQQAVRVAAASFNHEKLNGMNRIRCAVVHNILKNTLCFSTGILLLTVFLSDLYSCTVFLYASGSTVYTVFICNLTGPEINTGSDRLMYSS